LPDRLTASAASTVLRIVKLGPRIGAGPARLIGEMVFAIVAPDIELMLAGQVVGTSTGRSDIGGLGARHRSGGGKGNTSGTGENAFDFHAEKFAQKPGIANAFMTKELIRVTHSRPFGRSIGGRRRGRP